MSVHTCVHACVFHRYSSFAPAEAGAAPLPSTVAWDAASTDAIEMSAAVGDPKLRVAQNQDLLDWSHTLSDGCAEQTNPMLVFVSYHIEALHYAQPIQAALGSVACAHFGSTMHIDGNDIDRVDL